MNTNRTKAEINKGLIKIIDLVSKVVPINKVSSVYCFQRWLESNYQMAVNYDGYIQADYYNGSDNDMVNLFMEILNLAKGDHCYNGNYVINRLEFLANEGLHIIELQNAKKTSFKFTEDEAKDFISKVVKAPKKKSKSSSKKKSAKKIRRDKTGRFAKKR